MNAVKTESTGSSPSSTASTPKRSPNKRKPKVPKRSRTAEDVLDLSVFESGKYTPKHYTDTVDKDMREDLSVLHHVFAHSRKLVVITGAGVSVAAGIPDFRSSTGLFAKLKDELGLKTSGKAMFDASVYKDQGSTQDFHTTVQGLHKLCAEASPTKFHEYLNEIASEGRLTRLYTQNIDCLDTNMPWLKTKIPLEAPWPQTVQLHGTLFTMVCSKCGWLSDLNPALFTDGDAPECPECTELDTVRAVAGKRPQGIGKLRPRLVLYNEGNPDAEAIGGVSEADLLSKPDGLVVLGTSLKIPGVKRIVREMSQAVHAAKGACVWVNMDTPQLSREFDDVFDLVVKGDCQLIPELVRDYEKEKCEIDAQKEQAKQARREKSLAKKKAKEANTKITNTFKITKKEPVVAKSSNPLSIDFLLNQETVSVGNV